MNQFQPAHELLTTALVRLYKDTGSSPKAVEALSFHIDRLEQSDELIREGTRQRTVITISRHDELTLRNDDVIVLLEPDHRCIKHCTGDSFFCQEKIGDDTVWYWQVGDNTRSIRLSRGEDPCTAVGQQPILRWMLEKPLEVVKIFRASNPDHWHYVTYGLSSLYHTGAPERQFELSFRLACDEQSVMPEVWPIHVLEDVVKLLSRAVSIEEHFTIGSNMPFPDGSDSEIHGFTLVGDEQLKSLGGNNDLRILQLVGLTDAEVKVIASKRTEILTKLRDRNPLLITDIRRKSKTQ